jgi:anti-sigma factor RsiW
MNCSDINELAPLYVAGELADVRAAEFDAHLKTCSSCFRELETQARLDARLREVLLAEDLDVTRVNLRVRELIVGESLQAAVAKAQTRRGGSPWVTAAMGLAATFLLVVAGYLLVPGRVSPVYADAADDHQTEVVNHAPRHWISDPGQIAALAGKQGIEVAVPVKLASGYRLERAKICSLDGLTYLHLVYSDGAQEFSLFLRARDGEKLDGTIRGFSNGRLLRGCGSGSDHLASFTTSHLNAVVATEQSGAASLAYAKLASASIQD